MDEWLGATLLLFRKSALLGAITMMPVIVNILLIDIFILPPDYGPAVPAAIIFISLAMLLWRDLQNLIQVAWAAQYPEPVHVRKIHLWIRIVIVGVVSVMMLFGVLIRHR